MNTELETKKETVSIEKYSITEAELSRMENDYLRLQVKDETDQYGHVIVKKALMEVKSKRIAVEKRRKELKEEALQFGRDVDKIAKYVRERLEAVETHLDTQERIVSEVLERRKQAELAQLEEIKKTRLQSLLDLGMRFCSLEEIEGYGKILKVTELALFTGGEFEEKRRVIADCQREFLDNAKKAEEERLALEAKAKEQEVEIARLKAIEAEKKRQEELEQAKKESAKRAIEEERARQALKEKKEEEKRLAAIRQKEAEEKKKQEQLENAPDKQKLEAWREKASELLKSAPALSSKKGKEAKGEIVLSFEKLLAEFDLWLKKM